MPLTLLRTPNLCLECYVTCVVFADRDDSPVRGGAFYATGGAGGTVVERLRGHRHDAEGDIRLPQTPLRGEVSPGKPSWKNSKALAAKHQKCFIILTLLVYFVKKRAYIAQW